MKLISLISFILIFSLPLFCFSQSGLDKIIGITNILTQDTAKIKSGGPSSIAVTDAGDKGDKSKTSKVAGDNPIDKMKRDITPNAVQPTTTPTGGTTNNLAVTDAGAPGEKSKTTNKEAGTGATQGEPKKETAPTVTPK